MDDRDTDYSRRMELVEKRLGLGTDVNGGAAFTRREAQELESRLKEELRREVGGVTSRLADLDREVCGMDAKLDEIVRRTPGGEG
jgi:hypothetical protein